jgi:hypothetical protein
LLKPAQLAGLVAAGAIACSAGDPVQRPGVIDAGTEDLLAPPAIDPLPATTPHATVAVRGTTSGSRVVTQGALGATSVTAVLPGGSFCQDTPLAAMQDNVLRFYAVSGDGQVSAPVEASVVHDPEAASPDNATCSGAEAPVCGEVEICGNNKDDDCNGYIDECDLACSGCVDDEYGPNHFPFNVPTLLPGTYSLQLCPCRDDWFAFHRERFERIRVTATFQHSVIDLDMRLFHAGPDGNGTGPQVAASTTTTNVESIDYQVQERGTYYLRIYPAGQEKRNGPYTLRID